jgi:hypothetical protein
MTKYPVKSTKIKDLLFVGLSTITGASIFYNAQVHNLQSRLTNVNQVCQQENQSIEINQPTRHITR